MWLFLLLLYLSFYLLRLLQHFLFIATVNVIFIYIRNIITLTQIRRKKSNDFRLTNIRTYTILLRLIFNRKWVINIYHWWSYLTDLLLIYLILLRNLFKTFINKINVALNNFFILIFLILVLTIILILIINLRILIWINNLLYILLGLFWFFFFFNSCFIRLWYIILCYIWISIIIIIFSQLNIIINNLLLVKSYFLLCFDFFVALSYIYLQIINLLIQTSRIIFLMLIYLDLWITFFAVNASYRYQITAIL